MLLILVLSQILPEPEPTELSSILRPAPASGETVVPVVPRRRIPKVASTKPRIDPLMEPSKVVMTDPGVENELNFSSNYFLEELPFGNVPLDRLRPSKETLARVVVQMTEYKISRVRDPLDLGAEKAKLETKGDVMACVSASFLWIPVGKEAVNRIPDLAFYSHVPQVQLSNTTEGVSELVCWLCPFVGKNPLKATSFRKTMEHCSTARHLTAIYFVSGVNLRLGAGQKSYVPSSQSRLRWSPAGKSIWLQKEAARLKSCFPPEQDGHPNSIPQRKRLPASPAGGSWGARPFASVYVIRSGTL